MPRRPDAPGPETRTPGLERIENGRSTGRREKRQFVRIMQEFDPPKAKLLFIAARIFTPLRAWFGT